MALTLILTGCASGPSSYSNYNVQQQDQSGPKALQQDQVMEQQTIEHNNEVLEQLQRQQKQQQQQQQQQMLQQNNRY